MHDPAPDEGTADPPLYVDSIEIRELVPRRLGEAQLQSAVIRNFLNAINNLLYLLIGNSEDALKQVTSDHVAYDRLKGIAGTAHELESTIERLQSLVEGGPGFLGSATILVADDQEPVRNMLVKTLEQHGHTVFGASSGLEALEKCQAYPGQIHLVLADVGMEPMDGYELVRNVLLARPSTKAIYMSGNFPDYGRAMAGTEFLLKPKGLEGLPQKVRQMLNRP